LKISSLASSLGESLRFASSSIKSNPLRTFLSLFGITVGVFCIILIFTFVDSIRLGVEESINKLGSNTLYIQKWPWLFDSDYPWWKYINRQELDYKQMVALRKRMPEAEAIAFSVGVPQNKVESAQNSAESISITGHSDQYEVIKGFELLCGRTVSDQEHYKGTAVCVIGDDLAKNLFASPEASLGQSIKTMGRKLIVVGVLKHVGQGMGMGESQDLTVYIPINFLRSMGEFSSYNPTIYVKGVSKKELADVFENEVRGRLRLIRKLNPQEEDDFALNKVTMISNQLDKVFQQINILGWFIAGFSILVGGFGIANIMFVSVKERTHIIGIQKALGCPNYVIMAQFLGEAVILCVLGGLVGIGLVAIISFLVTNQGMMKLVITSKNVLIGVVLSSVIGVISGFIPSLRASQLDPIEAIRSGI